MVGPELFLPSHSTTVFIGCVGRKRERAVTAIKKSESAWTLWCVVDRAGCGVRPPGCKAQLSCLPSVRPQAEYLPSPSLIVKYCFLFYKRLLLSFTSWDCLAA